MKKLVLLNIASVVVILGTTASSSALPPDTVSRTAVVAATCRAIGAKNPDPAFRNPDDLAQRFIGEAERDLIAKWPMSDLLDMDYATAVKTFRERTGGFETPMAAHFVRTRRIDELLKQGVKGGIRQVVIRLKDVREPCQVYEVDHPSTQAYKKTRVREIIGAAPRNLVYVPIDFTKEDLRTVLAKAGCRPDKPAFFIWEGVTYYLPREAVESTLKFIGRNTAPKTEIVFDYVLASALAEDQEDVRLRGILRNSAAWGEPWLFGLPLNGSEKFLADLGLKVKSDIGKEEIEKLYLTRPDGTRVDGYPWWWRICHAAVPETQNEHSKPRSTDAFRDP